MALFDNKTFTTHDDYMTPDSAWEDIKHLIPSNKVIWEAFYGDGSSGDCLKRLGFDVIHEKVDFFENDLGEIIVSNPPFSKCKLILERLAVLNKPFILIMPCSKICTSYMRRYFKDKGLQIIIPTKRIHFHKIENGKPSTSKSSANFDCFYYCYKIGLSSDIIWL